MFHLLAHRQLDSLNEAALDIAQRASAFLGPVAATEVPGLQTTELTIGAASFQVTVDEARQLYNELLSASTDPDTSRPPPRARETGRTGTARGLVPRQCP
jgi:hypothetical protein